MEAKGAVAVDDLGLGRIDCSGRRSVRRGGESWCSMQFLAMEWSDGGGDGLEQSLDGEERLGVDPTQR